MHLLKTKFIALIDDIKKTGNYPFGLQDFVKKLDENHYNKSGFYLDELDKHFKSLNDSVSIEALFPTWTNDNNIYWGSLNTIIAFLLKHVLAENTKTDTTQKESDYVVETTTVIEGDLIVNGNLNVGYISENQIGLIVLGNLTITGDYAFEDGCMIVLGDLNIDGAFDERSDWSLTIVGGQVNAKTYLNSSGEFYALAKVTSPFLYFSYNHGHCSLNDGFRGLFFRESDHGSSFSLGDNEAILIVLDEMSDVTDKRTLEDYKAFRALFLPTAVDDTFATVDFDNFNEEEFDFDDVQGWLEEEHEVVLDDLIYALLEKVQAGEAIFKTEILDAFFA